MPTQIKLPNLGENIESGDVLTIFVSEGDIVKANQDLLEVETDKATMPIPAPQAGKITKILVERRRHGRSRRADHGNRSVGGRAKIGRDEVRAAQRRKGQAAPPKPKNLSRSRKKRKQRRS